MKTRYAEKRTRSANEPVIRDGVIMANFIWKRAYSARGMVGASNGYVAPPTFLNMKNVAGFPMKCPTSSPNARLKPKKTHIMLIIPMAIKLCNIVDITFFARTIPP